MHQLTYPFQNIIAQLSLTKVNENKEEAKDKKNKRKNRGQGIGGR
jgi:hypothetical protein